MVVITDEPAQHDSIIEVIDSRPSNQGSVIAVGPGRQLGNGRRSPMTVTPGDRVLIGRYAGYRYETDTGTIRLIDINDIVAVL